MKCNQNKDKYEDLNKRLRKCRCGGKVSLSGGVPWYQEFDIVCDSCHGVWRMHTYSPREAAERWGLDKS